jgi:hypothetical protein
LTFVLRAYTRPRKVNPNRQFLLHIRPGLLDPYWQNELPRSAFHKSPSISKLNGDQARLSPAHAARHIANFRLGLNKNS